MTPTSLPDRIKRETKRRTHDGMVWPVARAAMITRANIIDRMAEDLHHMLRERGMGAVVTSDDYLRLGWTREQVARFGFDAARRLAGENICGNDATRVMESA